MGYTLLNGTTVYPAQYPFQKITLTSNITLVWPSSFSNSIAAAGYNRVTTNQNGYVITLPDATLGSEGVDIIFSNVSLYNFIIHKSDNTLLYTIEAGSIIDFKLTDNSTAAGGWDIIPFLGGYTGLTAFSVESSDDSITITNGSVSPSTSVPIDFQLPPSLTNLNNLDVPGIVVATGNDPLTWNAVELVADSNISITNSDGVDGNPQFALSTSLSGLASIGVGSLTLTGSVISAGVTNGSVEIASDGTGSVYINGVVIDNNTNSNITVPGNLTVNGFFNNPFIPKAWCVFTDVIVGSSNDITVQNSQNVTSVTGSAGNYVITFTTPITNINYGVFITTGTNGGPALPFVSTGYWTVKELTYVSIVIVDASGALVTSVPNGVTVMIMST